jgi:hypothetical protein
VCCYQLHSDQIKFDIYSRCMQNLPYVFIRKKSPNIIIENCEIKVNLLPSEDSNSHGAEREEY